MKEDLPIHYRKNTTAGNEPPAVLVPSTSQGQPDTMVRIADLTKLSHSPSVPLHRPTSSLMKMALLLIFMPTSAPLIQMFRPLTRLPPIPTPWQQSIGRGLCGRYLTSLNLACRSRNSSDLLLDIGHYSVPKYSLRKATGKRLTGLYIDSSFSSFGVKTSSQFGCDLITAGITTWAWWDS